MGGEALALNYAQAFSTLLILLASITIFTAVVVVAFLGRKEPETVSEAAVCDSPAG
jgi:hypothetical protein